MNVTKGEMETLLREFMEFIEMEGSQGMYDFYTVNIRGKERILQQFLKEKER